MGRRGRVAVHPAGAQGRRREHPHRARGRHRRRPRLVRRRAGHLRWRSSSACWPRCRTASPTSVAALASKRASAWAVALLASVTGAVLMLGTALAARRRRHDERRLVGRGRRSRQRLRDGVPLPRSVLGPDGRGRPGLRRRRGRDPGRSSAWPWASGPRCWSGWASCSPCRPSGWSRATRRGRRRRAGRRRRRSARRAGLRLPVRRPRPGVRGRRRTPPGRQPGRLGRRDRAGRHRPAAVLAAHHLRRARRSGRRASSARWRPCASCSRRGRGT